MIFQTHRKDYNVMKRNFAGPPIIKDEIRATIRKMKRGKATGSDRVSVKILKALEDYEINKIAILLQEIYDTGQILPVSNLCL